MNKALPGPLGRCFYLAILLAWAGPSSSAPAACTANGARPYGN